MVIISSAHFTQVGIAEICIHVHGIETATSCLLKCLLNKFAILFAY